jgi:hypothetical protein
MDILPTVARLTGAALPEKPLDGVDIWPLLSGQQQDVNREVFLYFNDAYLQAARYGSGSCISHDTTCQCSLPSPTVEQRDFFNRGS